MFMSKKIVKHTFYIPEDVFERLEQDAADNHRSVTAQASFILGKHYQGTNGKESTPPQPVLNGELNLS